jgi:hypothetical protein
MDPITTSTSQQNVIQIQEHAFEKPKEDSSTLNDANEEALIAEAICKNDLTPQPQED